MHESQKPLHPYEQSMLLVALLFDSKNLKDILSFLPNTQSERVYRATEKFLKLSRNERMTEIVFELRRLLLVDEHRIDWIHQSWIDDALKKEPPYLRPVIEKAIVHGAQRKSDAQNRAFVPLPLVFNMFIDQLINTRQKTAMYDPVLMRLQSLKDDAHEDAFSDLGRRSLAQLAELLNHERFAKFLSQRGSHELPRTMSDEKNPFHHVDVRKSFLRELWQFNPTSEISIDVFAGLLTISLYLKSFKFHWRRTITLGLKRHLGLVIERIIVDQKTHVFAKNAQRDIAELIIASLDDNAP